MKVIYIAGPYRADTEGEVFRNIQNARQSALRVWANGAVALCPHMNTAFMGGEMPDRAWLEGDLELLSRCDAILMMENWTLSEGARAERQYALENGIDVLYERLGDVTLYVSGTWEPRDE